MRVLYDTQCFDFQKYGGISRYFVELMRHSEGACAWELPIKYSSNINLQSLPSVATQTLLERREIRGKQRYMNWVNRRLTRARMARGEYDLFHPTYYDPYFLRHLRGRPFVLTVHDMIHELFPQHMGKGDMSAVHKKLLCREANQIIAISNHTKRDLIEIYDVDPANIAVVYHGSTMKPTTKRKLTLPEHYILFTGQRSGYKNFARLAEAFAQLDSSLHLVCTGLPFSSEELELMARLKILDRTQVLYASEEELAELYSRAMLFVFPSLYEGFGIPILEAFACGCPIALSDASCFPEIARGAGAYFDPNHVDSILHTLERLLSDQAQRKSLVEQGAEELARFSWERTAQQTLELYHTLI